MIGRIGELDHAGSRSTACRLRPFCSSSTSTPYPLGVIPGFREVATVPPVRRHRRALRRRALHQAIVDELKRHAPPSSWTSGSSMYTAVTTSRKAKSLAFSVLLQDTRKTLTDAEVESAVSQPREILSRRLDAKLVEKEEKMTLTKAELADLLFEKVGFNKREAKDMVESFEEVRTALESGKGVKLSASATFSFATSRSGPDATRRQEKRFPSQPAAWSRSTPPKS